MQGLSSRGSCVGPGSADRANRLHSAQRGTLEPTVVSISCWKPNDLLGTLLRAKGGAINNHPEQICPGQIWVQVPLLLDHIQSPLPIELCPPSVHTPCPQYDHLTALSRSPPSSDDSPQPASPSCQTHTHVHTAHRHTCTHRVCAVHILVTLHSLVLFLEFCAPS